MKISHHTFLHITMADENAQHKYSLYTCTNNYLHFIYNKNNASKALLSYDGH